MVTSKTFPAGKQDNDLRKYEDLSKQCSENIYNGAERPAGILQGT